MSKVVIISFCFGLTLERGVKFQDMLLIVISIIGAIANIANLISLMRCKM